jgi:hypothetical protein
MFFKRIKKGKDKGGVTLRGANVTYQSRQEAANEKVLQEQRTRQEAMQQEQRLSADIKNQEKRQEEKHDADKRRIELEIQERVKKEFSKRNHGRGPDALSYDQGNMFPIPEGAVGPIPTRKGDGIQYRCGSGGNGLHENTYGVRFHYEGKYHPERVIYFNKHNQTIDPTTGKPIGRKDPLAHMKAKKKNF